MKKRSRSFLSLSPYRAFRAPTPPPSPRAQPRDKFLSNVHYWYGREDTGRGMAKTSWGRAEIAWSHWLCPGLAHIVDGARERSLSSRRG